MTISSASVFSDVLAFSCTLSPVRFIYLAPIAQCMTSLSDVDIPSRSGLASYENLVAIIDSIDFRRYCK